MKSYSKIVRQKIKNHILEHYDERGIAGIAEDMETVKYNNMGDNDAAKHIVEGGNFLISYYDQRAFIDSLDINDTHKEYSDDQVFKKYVALLAREIVNLVKEYREQ